LGEGKGFWNGEELGKEKGWEVEWLERVGMEKVGDFRNDKK